MPVKNISQKVNLNKYSNEYVRIFGDKYLIESKATPNILKNELDPVVEAISKVEPITIRRRYNAD